MIIFKNTSGQKIRLRAFDATTGLPKTGDAANLTAYVNIDWAGVTALTDTSATELSSTNDPGGYLFDLTQSETNGNVLVFSAKSSTSNIVLVSETPNVVPANFTALSVDGSGRVDAAKISGTTQTARDLGASVLLSSGTGTGQVLLSSGQVTVGTNNDKTGYGLSGTQTFNLTGNITGNVTGSVGSVTGAVGSVTAPVTAGTVTDKTDYTLSASGSAALTEGYRTNGATGTLGQLLYEVVAHLGESSIAGTTKTIKKLDHSTTAETFTLDDATAPNAVTRAS